MSLAFPPEFESFVNVRIASGAYASEQEVLRTAFDLLERREQLLAHIDEGTHQLRSGECEEYGEGDRDRFRADIAARPLNSDG
jgi:putative addiction module CopG family antidote